jgi:hypothetical protein
MKQRVGDLFPRKWVNEQSLPGPLLVQLGEFEPTTLNGKRVLTARKPKMASQDSAPSALDAEG